MFEGTGIYRSLLAEAALSAGFELGIAQSQLALSSLSAQTRLTVLNVGVYLTPGA